MRYARRMALGFDQLEASATKASATDDIGEAKAFTLKLLALSLDEFSDEQLDRLEELVENAISALSRNPSEDAAFLVITLHEALRGIRHGLPPDPRRRPTAERLAAEFEEDLKAGSL
jgi:hypothetical protein